MIPVLRPVFVGAGIWLGVLILGFAWSRLDPHSDLPMWLLVFASGICGGMVASLIGSGLGSGGTRTASISASSFALMGIYRFIRSADQGGMIQFVMFSGIVFGLLGASYLARAANSGEG